MAEPDELLRVLVERSPLGQFVATMDGTVVLANEAYAELLGRPLDEVQGLRPADVVHPDDVKLVIEEGGRLFSGEIDRMVIDTRYPRGDTLLWVRSTTTIVHDADGKPQWFVTFVEDITERRAAEHALRTNEHLFRTLAESLPVGLYRSDDEGRLTYANPQWEEIVGHSFDDWKGRSLLDLVHPDDRDRVVALRSQSAGSGEFLAEYRIERPDGAIRWVSSRSERLRDDDGEPGGWVGSIEDITVLRAAQEATRRLALIAENTSDIVGIADDAGALVYLNHAARATHGFLDRDFHGVPVLSLYTPNSRNRVRDEVVPSLAAGRTWSGELDMYAADGSVMKVWQTIAPDLRDDGTLRSASGVGRDITEQKRAEAELAFLATHDSLTGLPNRVLLLEHVEVAIQRAARRKHKVALLFIDLDNFKDVNDTYGHEAGDHLLRQVAQRLKSVVRAIDIVARLGGDEFVVLCGEVGDEVEVASISGRVLDGLCEHPFEVDGNEFDVTASIGVAILDGADAQPETLLREADAAMYRAKANGRARVEVLSA